MPLAPIAEDSVVTRIRSIAVEAWLPVLLVGLWWFVSSSSSSFYFPPLREIMTRFADLWFSDQFAVHVVPSLRNFGIGFLLGVTIGILCGLALGSMPQTHRALSPTLEFIRATPVIALVPLTIVLLGTDVVQKVAIIAFACMWPTLLNTVDGVRAVDPLVRDVARSYRLGRWDSSMRVFLRSATPQIIAGMRTSVAVAVVAMVGSELFASSEGIGYFVLQSQRTYAMTDMWAGLIMLGLLGYGLNLLFALLERRTLRWHRLRLETTAAQ
ncbi:ABC transporter permease [Rhodococcus sp. 15-725-2-2b]|nr:ABC transporter [Rhodococcus sp. B7740]OZC63761.1 ABC transporter permease [Rhodococcus sp. 06-462-5]OZC72486.1 ABC transporter permease [Rhodococcus sp. 06-469-3-2]OZD48711.1 ABC transporter permease [Rhodococcus sp. 06-1477-1A]OZE03358.1 ABC transporter permease [Rhodococcus sp. 05-2255-3C]OZE09745.1 ABC transporter permease [Rhodococcus sp. 05-2255-3B1]OZE15012.1 ABC transporter permease [Rhodococcus sp. 05-2255-2A2]OZE61516.1 ABC transporter permease [Rhodococcus sp. 02-925g]OZE77495